MSDMFPILYVLSETGILKAVVFTLFVNALISDDHTDDSITSVFELIEVF